MNTPLFRNDAPVLARQYGIHLEGVRDYFPAGGLAMDADGAVTAANSGIPAIFTTYTDPVVIRALVAPTRAAQIYGEVRKGDWVTDTAMFPVVELSGRTAAYGDYSADGEVDANANWISRQSFHYQTWTRWGEREVARMGAARIDLVNQRNLASISVLNKQQNLTYLFGVAGLECYGALNDPQLPPAIQPLPKVAANGAATGSADWLAMSDPLQCFDDVLRLYAQLVTQMGGNLTLETPMTLVIPTERQQCLLYANQYNVKLRELLSESLPNLRIETLPEAGTALGGGMVATTLMQLFVNEVEGQASVSTGFTEKMRAHAVERHSTSVRQKKSQGTWGTLWFYPQACATMTGI
ncbi:DUF2184 domain-containing protein [Novacetimonas pomaceti]|uniref:DUF2184 domain-containing protein n=1 Tax=Novacetimonas pomaceti TaxID=2021998 RepID=A0ABX5P051_9PROT|nr:DUF2184 domain-containing protein [Novacetimonas pomaceti]PYD47138.1 DUF2184 domain-containing protein [Novacetimonas pomaceti]